MVFKFHQHRFDNFNNYYEVIREAMKQLGHSEVVEESPADIHFYNHIVNDSQSDNMIIVKPTAPTSKHFALDTLGYANSSSLAFNKPLQVEMRYWPKKDWDIITDLINKKSNKWDDSILLKWRKPKIKIPEDHILVIGQMPDDETVHGFGFGDHIVKLKMIVDKLHSRNVVIKLHPRYKNPVLVKKWEDAGHTVITGYQSIHSILPKTRVAITENSTAGIECMMHDVPIISYGYPDYHWITKDLRILTRLNNYIDNLQWFNKKQSRDFLCWYVFNYLCTDVESTVERLEELL